MKKHKLILLVIICICVVPVSISAGVICNDGWESSCPVSAPGCCSSHGGVAGGGTYTGNAYGGSSGSSNYNSGNDGSFNEWMLILLFGGGFVVYYIVEQVHQSYETNKILEQRRIKSQQEKLIQQQREQEKLEKQKREIGTTYDSRDEYIKVLIRRLNNLNINKTLILDGYFKSIDLDELLINPKINNRYDSFKHLIDICHDTEINIKDKILSFDKLNRNEMKYFIKVYNGLELNIKDLVKHEKFKFIDLILDNNKSIECNDLLKIYNESHDMYQKIIDYKFKINYIPNDIVDIIRIDKLYDEYIRNGNKFDYDNVLDIYVKIISISDKKTVLFLNKHLNELKRLNKKDSRMLILAYYSRKKNTFKFLSDFGFNNNVCPLKKDQDNIVNILSDDYKWVDFKIDSYEYFDYKPGVILFLDDEYLFDSFLKYYDEEKNKNIVYKGEPLIIWAIKHNNYKSVEFLLNEGCNLFTISNTYNTNGFNPLVYSIYKRHYKITKLLIEKGLNVNYPDSYGNTALDYACGFANNLDLCEFIINNGGICSENNMIDKIRYAIEKNDKDLLPNINIEKINELKKKKD